MGDASHGTENVSGVCNAASSRRRGAREVTRARESAEEALLEYAEALRYWNRPDDEHTRHQLRRLVEDVIEETLGV